MSVQHRTASSGEAVGHKGDVVIQTANNGVSDQPCSSISGSLVVVGQTTHVQTASDAVSDQQAEAGCSVAVSHECRSSEIQTASDAVSSLAVSRECRSSEIQTASDAVSSVAVSHDGQTSDIDIQTASDVVFDQKFQPNVLVVECVSGSNVQKYSVCAESDSEHAHFILPLTILPLPAGGDDNVAGCSGMYDGDGDHNTAVKSRKRKRNVANWHCNVRKLRRNQGQEYETKSGKVVHARKFDPCENHKCCKKGSECHLLTLEQRQEIFSSFWRLSDFNLQTAFICCAVTETPAATHTVLRNNSAQPEPRLGKAHYKDVTRTYVFSTDQGPRKVCKEFFLRTLSISNGRLHRALLNKRVNSGMIVADKRGKNVKRRIPHADRQCVVNHINRFPRYVSHYTRNHQQHREYLSPSLNITIMYDLYKREMLCEGHRPVKESFYRHIFETDFNLHFHQPLKDTCRRCDSFEMQLKCDSGNSQIKSAKELHLRKADKVRKLLNDCKTVADQSSVCFTFDLQKTLICPVISTGVAYYKRQLATYNLGIHNLANDSATMYMWHEGVASRGANEIGSCLIKYAENAVHNGAKSLTAFCDSCGGQNRNFKIASVMSFLVSNYQLDSFTVHFMQSGHSFLPNDADFGVIEKYKRVCGDVYIPQHWIDVVKSARKRNPFEVVEMTKDDFADVTSMSKELTNRKKAEDGSQVKWLDIQTIRFCSEAPSTMQVQYVCDQEGPWYSVNLAKDLHSKCTHVRLQMCDGSGRKISREKYNDLQSLKPYIPPTYHGFYDSLEAVNVAAGCEVLGDLYLDVSEDEDSHGNELQQPTPSANGGQPGVSTEQDCSTPACHPRPAKRCRKILIANKENYTPQRVGFGDGVSPVD